MKKKIVILGATGTVGNKISENLINEGHHVILIARHIEKLERYRSLGAEIIAGDITDVETLTSAFANADGAFILLPDNVKAENTRAYQRDVTSRLIEAIEKSGSNNQWRKIVGKGDDYPLQINSNTRLMDLRLEKDTEIILPESPAENAAFLFYVFDGKININGTMSLVTGESVLVEIENPTFQATETSDIVLFITQTNAVHFDGGMYSCNLQ
ncbi:NAD(P)H-binding protein [Pedobacter endophyticus]|uniref:SDR family NAD(P)-dependent oxidoreductase n=1 Tax=Pedobacter endophyticus TaxID=2789740 RepID=A0A7U3Q4W2_9SPHI|nr:NAD(P)H-binding protein [Pedobacter endophyticus]QPH38622.1 SDR family NAD(P)-dependent oxidoreductase [Pedobacter endophyticus]